MRLECLLHGRYFGSVHFSNDFDRLILPTSFYRSMRPKGVKKLALGHSAKTPMQSGPQAAPRVVNCPAAVARLQKAGGECILSVTSFACSFGMFLSGSLSLQKRPGEGRRDPPFIFNFVFFWFASGKRNCQILS